MSKSRKDYGVIRTPTGGEAVVRNRHVSDMIQDQQAKIQHLDKRAKMCEEAAHQIDIALTALRSHWWTKAGRFLRVGLPR